MKRMVWKILEVCFLVIYLVINVIVARKMSARDMHDDFIEGQCFVGMVCANIFYAPAWLLKFIKFFVLLTIK